ncbi:histidine phosphatase family protein [Frondihabitans australicus]|uniref:Putative phosphoglycerate mutase n=1 Tax=Frondihabitans australicus TaxID=386892 RepID=A0A495ICD0_9MICO|nr:histidine phosphatase family protein [Frondihabitans australicus]RKR73663.1 putative phosphoglycerate mutase [Frondihabitans australicus]
MRLELIRHGQTDWNLHDQLQGSSDIPLNDTGREQAHRAALLLAPYEWSAIVSSPLMRARETAEIIAAELGIELGAAYPELIERDYASREGTVATTKIPDEPNEFFPDIEPRGAVAERGLAAIADIRDSRLPLDGDGANIAVVCHGTIIRFTLSALLGREVGHIHNAAANQIEWRDGRWHVLSINDEPVDSLADAVDETVSVVGDQG